MSYESESQELRELNEPLRAAVAGRYAAKALSVTPIGEKAAKALTLSDVIGAAAVPRRMTERSDIQDIVERELREARPVNRGVDTTGHGEP